MSPVEFRKYALSLEGVVEGAHQRHADFRFANKIFATLGVPDDDHAMVRLTCVQQSFYCQKYPDVFLACNGAWGKQGYTFVNLSRIKKKLATEVLCIAYQNLVTASG